MKASRTALIALIAVASTVSAISAEAKDRRQAAEDRELARGRAAGLHSLANPSALIAAELALGRLARKDGEWKALRETAADEAEMFVPERVRAADWLKTRDGPGEPTRRDGRSVWMSCDGSFGVVHGIWQRRGNTGGFVTVWQRQKDRSYKWLLDFRDAGGEVDAKPQGDTLEMITARVADCLSNQGSVPSGDFQFSASKDRSIHWREGLLADGRWDFGLQGWNGQDYAVLFEFTGSAASAE